MQRIKKICVGIFILGMCLGCIGLEFYTYRAKETLSSSKEEAYVVSGAVIENKQEKEEKEKKVAYLTFDDGPSPVTERVLDVLKVYEVNATFFLIGSNINEETEELVKREVEEGHVIGIHTYSHKAEDMYSSAENYKKDFLKAEKALESLVKMDRKLCRFPWGSANNYLSVIEGEALSWLEQKGYTYCDWNVSGEDAVGTPTSWSIYHNVQKDFGRYDKPVILLHDGSSCKLTADVLPDIIVMLKDAGYSFDTLDHMESPYQFSKN